MTMQFMSLSEHMYSVESLTMALHLVQLNTIGDSSLMGFAMLFSC